MNQAFAFGMAVARGQRPASAIPELSGGSVKRRFIRALGVVLLMAWKRVAPSAPVGTNTLGGEIVRRLVTALPVDLIGP
jgi:hypothetical protein